MIINDIERYYMIVNAMFNDIKGYSMIMMNDMER